MKIDEVRTDWPRVPFSPPIADSTHVLEWMDLDPGAGPRERTHRHVLSFNYAPSLLKGIVDCELKRHVIGQDADNIRDIYERNRRNR